ncbi:MAG: tRNA adenylyltransferase [Myxococcales bacterium]|nr:tRNA adenylyltransferase [Myxococcales bacterium]
MTDATEDQVKRLLAAAVPATVREVCAKLAAAGHQAVAVGGAVRDALLGREAGDWDVATSATPHQVIALFRRTAPTGIEHGTVLVILGKDDASKIEVTTFRGEGAYSDARRPDHVRFGVPLVEDLQRRDLVVNAIAYDPINDQLIDPFGGREDIARRRLRAVGDPVARFTEDGLRVMRAMRFASQLEFDLDPETEAGIAAALPSLAKVSRERVSVELRKTLATRQPSRGLVIAKRTAILLSVLPELDARIDDPSEWASRVDRAIPRVRLGALLAPLADPEADPLHLDREVVNRVLVILRALKFSNLECDLAAQLVGIVHASRGSEWTPVQVRRLLSELDRDKRVPAIELWESDRTPNRALIEEARRVITEGHALAIKDLAITGKDLMTALDMAPGPSIGRILVLLLERVIEDPSLNDSKQLLQAAQRLELEVGHGA